MKKYLLYVLAMVFCSCAIEYDGETRLVVESYVRDTEGNPIAGKAVSITVSDGYSTDNISNGTTDSNGRSLLIFPSPKSDSTTVHISFAADENHQGKHFTNISKDDFGNYKLVLDDITLFRTEQITTLNIELNQTASTVRLNEYWIEGDSPESNIDYDVDVSEPQTYSFPINLQLLKNQEVILYYSITDMNTMTTTESFVNIAIGNDPVTYVLTY